MPESGLLLRLPDRVLDLGRRTHIMGVVNVTPDSFSDGGRFLDSRTAVEQGLKLAGEGADILDVGGESTRPGSEGVSAQEELDRVLPVIQGLAAGCGAVISIDTSKAVVAEAAIKAGASIINDISALGGDPSLAEVAARTGAGLILMHMLGTPKTMQARPVYQDVVSQVRDFLAQRAEQALGAGVEAQRIVVDPGIGFGKTLEHNLKLIRRLDVLAGLGYPVLLGASRKAFLGKITGQEVPARRRWSSWGVHLLGAALGAHIVRVHEVEGLGEALMVTDAVMRTESAA